MPVLPETGLTGSPVNNHINHHETLHALNNRFNVAGTGYSSVLMKDTSASGWSPYPISYCFAENTKTVAHSSSGILTFSVTSFIRVVRVNAGANITGLNVTGMDSYGPFGQIWIRLVATANITVNLSNVNVIGGAPTALANGESTVFQLHYWNF